MSKSANHSSISGQSQGPKPRISKRLDKEINALDIDDIYLGHLRRTQPPFIQRWYLANWQVGIPALRAAGPVDLRQVHYVLGIDG
jgi:hypothetical protein